MKTLLLILLYFISFNLYAGTCSSISRVDYSANQILTSSSLNSQLNTVYTGVNSFDGGCTTDGTLEKGALNTTDFNVPLKSNRTGCRVVWATSATMNIEPCFAAVNGNWVNTTSNTGVSWANIDTGAEAASTTYYVYIKTGSNTTTLTPEISVTGPTGNGYNGDGDRILASFRNDGDGNIATDSIHQWIDGNYKSERTTESAYLDTSGAGTILTRNSGMVDPGSCAGGTGFETCNFEASYWSEQPTCTANVAHSTAGRYSAAVTVVGTASFTIGSFDIITQTYATPSLGYEIICHGKLAR